MRKEWQVRKRHITLLELIIAMSLAMIILSTLTYFYHQVSLINAEMDRQQNESFQMRYAENRLAQVLPRAVSSTDPSNNFHFFTGPNLAGLFKPGTQSLVFTFDNCVQLDKEMSYHVIGRIYLSEEGDLVLAKWPVEKRWKENEIPPVVKEVLLENVEDLSFSFYIPPGEGTAGSPADAAIPQDLRGGWVDNWPKEYRQLPAIVKVTVTQEVSGDEERKPLDYVFPLPHTLNPITYRN